MAVNLDKVREKASTYRDSRDGKSKFSKNYGVKPDSIAFTYFCPPVDPGMDGLPWSERMVHKRDLTKEVMSTGIEFSIGCQRDTREDKIVKCHGCIRYKKERDQVKVEGDPHDKKAGQFSPKTNRIAQVCDFSPLFSSEGELKRKLKKCFLKHGNEKYDCDSCYLNEQCKAGVQKYYMPVSVWEALVEAMEDEGDVTNPEKALCIRIKRRGSGKKNTRYKGKAVKDALEIPEKVMLRIKKKMIDLSIVDPKPTGSKEELKKLYDAFLDQTDVDGEEEESDNDAPDCLGEYDADKAKKRHCKKCDYKGKCIEEDKSEDDDDEDEDNESIDEDTRRPKKFDKLRDKLKEGSKKGKHNKSEDDDADEDE